MTEPVDPRRPIPAEPVGPDSGPSTDPDPITNPEPITTPGGRIVAPGGWRRAVTGLVVGAAAGIVHRLARAVDESTGRPGGGARR